MSKLLFTAVTSFVAIAEFITGTCVVWIFGQEDMPEELL